VVVKPPEGKVRGVLIGESIRLNADVRVRFEVTGITRFPAPEEPAGGPPWWTFIEFEADIAAADELAGAFAAALDDSLPWYASYNSADEMFVVFAGRVFRYPLGMEAPRGEVEAYARSIGVPESQLDWEQ
jgi:hypothetical protein